MTAEGDWYPVASWDALRRRAALLATCRSFFADRNVLEVETPLLARHAASDPHLASIAVRPQWPGAGEQCYFLQTSPEFAMKRLLAAGSGPIYQICKAFRDGEAGRLHNPEFTLLEWYRPGFDHVALMDEIDDWLGQVGFGGGRPQRLSYRDAFMRHAGVDPFAASTAELADCLRHHNVDIDLTAASRDTWLDAVLTQVVEPAFRRGRLDVYVYDYPASQAALARVRVDGQPLAERFELYLQGIEVANGYHELTDAAEQRRRFQRDRATRRQLGLSEVAADERLLGALEAGLPDCAGVAVGLDRILLLLCDAKELAEVLAFPIADA